MVHLSTKELKWVLVNCLLAKWVKCSEYTVPCCGASYSPKITNAPAGAYFKDFNFNALSASTTRHRHSDFIYN